MCHVKDNLKLCSNCRKVYYCCMEHQRENWASHQLNCCPFKVNGSKLQGTNRKDSGILSLSDYADVTWTFTRNLPANSLVFTDNHAELMMYIPESLQEMSTKYVIAFR